MASPCAKSVLATLDDKTFSMRGWIAERDTFTLFVTTESDGTTGNDDCRTVVPGVTVSGIFDTYHRSVGRAYRELFDTSPEASGSDDLSEQRCRHPVQQFIVPYAVVFKFLLAEIQDLVSQWNVQILAKRDDDRHRLAHQRQTLVGDHVTQIQRDGSFLNWVAKPVDHRHLRYAGRSNQCRRSRLPGSLSPPPVGLRP